MGFAILPEEPKLGVYVHKDGYFLFVVTEANWIFGVSIIYKSRQRKPRRAKRVLINDSIYLGEL